MIEGTDEIIDPFTYSITEDITFVASIREYKVVTFTVDDSVISTQNIITNDELEIPTPEKEHYTFLGWSLDGESVIDLSSYQINSDTNLIAVFEIKGALPYTFNEGVLTGYTGNDFKITLPTSYSIVDGYFVEGNDIQVTAIGNDAFKENSIINNVVIPNGYISIGSNAFYACSKLSVVTIGESISSIGFDSFFNCYALSIINYNATNVTSSSEAFGCLSSSGHARVIIGNNVLILPNCFSGGIRSSLVEIVEFEDNSICKEIGRKAFSGAESLKEIVIPSSVNVIGNYAFSGCSNLEKVIIESSEIYKLLVNENSCSYLIKNANTIKVLKSIVDNSENSNAFLNDSANYTKTIEGNYYIYTKN